MNSKPNIAVVAGGDSSEYVVSLNSAGNIMKAVDTKKFIPWLVLMQKDDWQVMDGRQKIAEVNKSDFSFILNGKKINFDFAYITIHGTPGEDGILQGYLSLQNIPHSASSLESSSLTFNKWFCNNYLKNFGVKMAKSVKAVKGDKIDSRAIINEIGLPLFVKPAAGGSSFGVTKVKTENDLIQAVEDAWTESDVALVEEFIDGTEFTCGVVKTGNETVILPVTEIIPQNEFFDFEAKYTPGATDEITPARLPKELYEKCRQTAHKIYNLCECDGIARVDFILKDDEFYFLEVNTIPGMTSTSFIPQQLKAMNLTLTEIITKIIENKLNT